MTEQVLTELERAWAVLGTARRDEFESFPLAASFEGHPCRAATDRSGGRHLLIPTLGEQVVLDSRPAVLGLAERQLAFDGESLIYIDVSCREKDLFGEFDEVLDEVLTEIHGSDRPAGTAIRVVARWRKLFRSLLVRGLSHTAKVGLFGELAVLAELVKAHPEFPVSAWRGPLNEPHDFEAPQRCLEIKSLGSMSEEIVIHGLAQLDVHDGRSLDLVLLRVVDDPAGLTIGELVADLETAVAAPGELRSRLADAGWDRGASATDTDTFSVEEVRRVPVDSTTPRIVNSSLTGFGLPSGVVGLSYEVELGGLLPLSRLVSLAELAEESV